MPTLLLVDDDPAILSALVRLLRHEGYGILCAGNGSDGFAHLANHDVGVVVCDGLIQQMTGAEFLAVVQREYPAVVRIMLTGYSDRDAVEQALRECDLFRFVTKPWDNQELIDTLRAAFQACAATEAGSAGAADSGLKCA